MKIFNGTTIKCIGYWIVFLTQYRCISALGGRPRRTQKKRGGGVLTTAPFRSAAPPLPRDLTARVARFLSRSDGRDSAEWTDGRLCSFFEMWVKVRPDRARSLARSPLTPFFLASSLSPLSELRRKGLPPASLSDSALLSLSSDLNEEYASPLFSARSHVLFPSHLSSLLSNQSLSSLKRREEA